jgi:hypothetical protein
MIPRFPGWILLWLFAWTAGIHAQAEYRYSYVPKQVYTGQVFPLSVLAVGTDPSNSPTFRFDPKSPLQPLKGKPIRVANGRDAFYTFYFKAGKGQVKLPDLYIQEEGRTLRLPGNIIPVATLDAPPEERFCRVIASDFKIRTSQVSTFDDHNNLIYLNLEAHEANLEDMQIPGIVEGGVEKVSRRGSQTTAEYYFVIPANVGQIRFSYYNHIKRQFVPLTVSTSYRDKQVTTQEDLNPRDSSFTQFKKYTFGALSLFFLLMFIGSRDFFYLVLLTLTLITLFTLYSPLKTVCVREGTPLYILPIPGSTVGMRIDKASDLPTLHRYKHYYKVEYGHGITGWIKDEDLCKD